MEGREGVGWGGTPPWVPRVAPAPLILLRDGSCYVRGSGSGTASSYQLLLPLAAQRSATAAAAAAAAASTPASAELMAALHDHCASCVNQRCTTGPRPGSSCGFAACALACGAAFHACKGAEHRLLCPLERVPCLNRAFGCPLALPRHRMAAHLEVCPAGLVCCTMEWNRWPGGGGGGIGGAEEEEPEQLDMALALQDQRTLLESLKVVATVPTAEMETVAARTKVRSAASSDSPESASAEASPSFEHLPRPSPGLAPPGSAKQRIANGINGLTEEHYGQLYEATVETARSLAAALDLLHGANAPERGTPCTLRGGERESGAARGQLTNGLDAEDAAAAEADAVAGVREQCHCDSCLTANARHLAARLPGEPSPGTTGSAARQGQDQMDTSSFPPPPHGENFKAWRLAPYDPPCTPHVSPGIAQRAGHMILEDRGLVVLEDRGTDLRFHRHQVFRHGVGPFMASAGRRGPLPDRSHPTSPPAVEDRAVDTSDLEQETAVDPMGLGEVDPVAAALLFCLEESRECRRISDRVRVDGRRVDVGTQTFTFPVAILVTDTRVGDMASASACDHAAPQLSCPGPLRTLRLGLEVPHGRYLPCYQHTFSFVCGQAFRRDQFSWHSANVHADIHAGLSGWMERRCPLAYYGCTFSQRRLCPAGPVGARVVHDGRLRSFGVRPHGPGGAPPPRGSPPSDRLTGLPMEVLWHIAGFLDSFSLCQLSVASRGMRDVCASLLQTRGVVELQWERRQGPPPDCTVSWRVKNKVWRFSTAFSAVPKWRFSELPSMSDHLRKCRFNTPEPVTEPVPLPAMCTARDRHSLRRLLRPVNK
ncbi:unnamed protein product [Merluccius merluccius]